MAGLRCWQSQLPEPPVAEHFAAPRGERTFQSYWNEARYHERVRRRTIVGRTGVVIRERIGGEDSGCAIRMCEREDCREEVRVVRRIEGEGSVVLRNTDATVQFRVVDLEAGVLTRSVS